MFDNKYPYTDFHELNLDWFMGEFKKLVAEWEETKGEWNSLHDYVQNYFENLNVQTEINNKINAMILDGTFADIVSPFVTAALPALVAGQLPDVVAAQISAVVAAQIDAVVAGQLPAIAAAAAAQEVGAWLAAHINPDTGYVIDDSLTVSQAAADAKAVGLRLTPLYESITAGQLKSKAVQNLMPAYENIIQGKYAYGTTVGGQVILGTNASYDTHMLYLPVNNTTLYMTSCRYWALVDDQDQLISYATSSGTTITSLSIPANGYKLYVSYNTTEIGLYVSEVSLGRLNNKFMIPNLVVTPDNDYISDGGINISKISTIKPKGNLLPYLANFYPRKYYYGDPGDSIRWGGNASYEAYGIMVKPNTHYYMTSCRMWGLADENFKTLAGSTQSFSTIISDIDTTSYPTAKYLFVSYSAGATVYLSEGSAKSDSRYELEGLTQTYQPQENTFCIPDFTFITGKDFPIYADNAYVLKDQNTKLTTYTGDKQNSNGYTLKASSAGTRSYTLTSYENITQTGSEVFSFKTANKNARNVTALFIGDSTINNGGITQKVLNCFTDEGVTCTLLGLNGSGSNHYEAISGWNANACYNSATFSGHTNNLYDADLGHFDIGSYLSNNNYSDPDFIFLQFGINDMFQAPVGNIDAKYNTYKTAMLNIIENIHNYNASIKIVVNMILMPNSSVDVYGNKYGTQYYSWERRAVDIETNSRLIADMPNYVILNPHHLVLDASTMIYDDVHPTATGYAVLGELDADVIFAN